MPANATQLQWASTGSVSAQYPSPTSVRLTFPPSAVNGYIEVKATNGCGLVSAVRRVNIKLPACPLFFSKGESTSKLPANDQNDTGKDSPGFDVSISPNPTASQFNIRVRSTDSKQVTIRVLDMQGRALKQFTMHANTAIAIGSDMAPGSYLVEIRQGDKTEKRRLVKL
jgi:hypothetical protein